MMRSLWTAASGMVAQQTNLDTVANNLSNVNSTGYKAEKANFKSLIYQSLQRKSYDSNGDPKPVSAQVGLGVRVASISTDFTQGNLQASSGSFDYALQGEGFFMVQLEDGSVGYTRNGNFNISLLGGSGENTKLAMTDAEGHPVLDSDGNAIVFNATMKDGGKLDTSKIQVDAYGNFSYQDADGNQQPMNVQMGLGTFPNPAGLERTSDTVLKESEASGQVTVTTAYALGSKVCEGYLEGSNVQVADEMVNMIIAQRAYEMNSKAITASDQMLQQANNLRS